MLATESHLSQLLLGGSSLASRSSMPQTAGIYHGRQSCQLLAYIPCIRRWEPPCVREVAANGKTTDRKESLEICPTPLGYMHGGHLDAIVPAYSIWLMQGIGTSLSLFQMMFVCDLASNKSRLDEGHAYLGMFIVKSYYVHTEVGNIGTYVTTWGI